MDRSGTTFSKKANNSNLFKRLLVFNAKIPIRISNRWH